MHMNWNYAQDTPTTEYPCKYNSLANQRGRQEAPPDPNSFNFMQFGGKLAKSYNHMLAPQPLGLAPPPMGNPGFALAIIVLKITMDGWVDFR